MLYASQRSNPAITICTYHVQRDNLVPNQRASLTNSRTVPNQRASLTNSRTVPNQMASLTNSRTVPNQRASLTNSRTVPNQRASLTNSRGRVFAVDYRELQRTVQTVQMATVGVNKRTLRPAYTAVGVDVLPRFLCIAAAEVGDLFEDPVAVFYKQWEDRFAAAALLEGLDKAKLERLLNSEVARAAREMWVEIEKINIRRPVPMLARSFAMFWMRMFFEAVDETVKKCVV
jgi:hypothetical protein